SLSKFRPKYPLTWGFFVFVFFINLLIYIGIYINSIASLKAIYCLLLYAVGSYQYKNWYKKIGDQWLGDSMVTIL
ncbi:MAG: hypothetical protein Q4P13_09695, partial [Psychrobacter sp.]|nr:hypothetical protein [Psychrobacter sp.]